MGKLIEVNHVSLGGEIGSPDKWAFPYLNEDHIRFATAVLEDAEALLLGRMTYQGLSEAYMSMPPGPFVDRMNEIPKYVATTTLRDLGWNATAIKGDVATSVRKLKDQSRGNIVKYGNGILDVPLIQKGLIDEIHLLLTPVAVGRGIHLFESMEGSPQLHLLSVDRFRNGVVLLVYKP
jgi:dihydrofolate reductase